MSDESTMTLGGPAGIVDKKIERIDESLDLKLNRFLQKWIAIIIFYQTTFIWRILGWALPAIPFIKLCLGFWIMLPQMKGEFYVYNFLLDNIIVVERKLMGLRC